MQNLWSGVDERRHSSFNFPLPGEKNYTETQTSKVCCPVVGKSGWVDEIYGNMPNPVSGFTSVYVPILKIVKT